MGTINYGYDHRCIEVTNEDLEFGNHPSIDKSKWMKIYSRDSRPLRDYQFEFWQCVLTYGYYDNACIDYVARESDKNQSLVLEDIRWYVYPKSKAQLLRELNKGYVREVRVRIGEEDLRYKPLQIGRSTFYQLIKGLDIRDEKEYDMIFAIIHEYLSKREEKLVNKALDNIVEVYDYDEYEYYSWTCKLKERKTA